MYHSISQISQSTVITVKKTLKPSQESIMVFCDSVKNISCKSFGFKQSTEQVEERTTGDHVFFLHTVGFSMVYYGLLYVPLG